MQAIHPPAGQLALPVLCLPPRQAMAASMQGQAASVATAWVSAAVGVRWRVAAIPVAVAEATVSAQLLLPLMALGNVVLQGC